MLEQVAAEIGKSIPELLLTVGVIYGTLKKTINGMKEDVSDIKAEQKEMRGDVVTLREDVACLKGRVGE